MKRVSELQINVSVAMVYCLSTLKSADTNANALMCVMGCSMKAMSFCPPVKPVILFPVYNDKSEVSLHSESRGGI